jgi:hypothetical protein
VGESFDIKKFGHRSKPRRLAGCPVVHDLGELVAEIVEQLVAAGEWRLLKN